mmetsp:Transcript_38293/g.89994  ORF Transcript_38293/g.89994 Transcript_38293/m.89994 type:complete len:248 (+) Transcript_38293:880-1623(+)
MLQHVADDQRRCRQKYPQQHHRPHQRCQKRFARRQEHAETTAEAKNPQETYGTQCSDNHNGVHNGCTCSDLANLNDNDEDQMYHASNCEDCIKPNRGHHVNLPLLQRQAGQQLQEKKKIEHSSDESPERVQFSRAGQEEAMARVAVRQGFSCCPPFQLQLHHHANAIEEQKNRGGSIQASKPPGHGIQIFSAGRDLGQHLLRFRLRRQGKPSTEIRSSRSGTPMVHSATGYGAARARVRVIDLQGWL